ncbi:MAG: hypothetical protein ACLP1X_11975 [Polyangiaceae bacterium]|jgi:hypothetical protein
MRLAFALSAAAVAIAPFGCSSILGDFSANGLPGGSEGGGDGEPIPSTDASSGPADAAMSSDSTTTPTDGATPEALAPADAPEAATPLQILSCNAWQNPSPTLVAQIFPSDSSGGGGNSQGPFNQLYLEHIPGMNAARIVVGTSTSMSSATTVYTVSESGGSNGIGTLTLPGTNLEAEAKTPNAVTFLVQQFMNSEYEYFSIADTDPGNMDSSLAIPQASIGSSLPNQPNMNGGGDFEMTFVEMATDSYYTLATYGASGGEYDLAWWLTTGQPVWQVSLGPGPQLQLGSSLVRDGMFAYGFFAPPGSGNNGPAALSQYTFATSTSAAPTSRSVIPSTSTASAVAVSAGVNGGYSLAFVELAGAQSANLRAGVVTETNINSFMVDDLPSLTFDVQSDAGFFDTTPFGGHNGNGGRWLSNGDLGLLGSGGTGGGDYTGLNFYVATPNGQWLVETAGTGKNVLPGQTTSGSAFDLSSSVTDILFQFDVAWIQELSDGSYALYFNLLKCQL